LQIFDGVCWIFLKLRIDDPLSAAPMHAFGGAWGIFFTGLLAKKEYVMEAYSRAPYYGVFYGSNGQLLASQLIGIITIAAWVVGLSGMLFFALKMLGCLRISEEDEHRGLDVSKHGGSAYNTHTAVTEVRLHDVFILYDT
jgi:Amt family ammonium transporter